MVSLPQHRIKYFCVVLDENLSNILEVVALSSSLFNGVSVDLE